MKTRASIAGVSGLALGACTPLASAQTTYIWATSGDGIFGEAINWSPMEVPAALDTAGLGGDGPYVVSINTSRIVRTLDIANPDAVVSLADGQTLTLDELFGVGELVVHRDTTSNSAVLSMPAGSTLAGRVRLNAGAGFSQLRARLRRTGSGDPVTITDTGSVFGRGVIEGGEFENFGRIEAVGPAALIELSRVTMAQGSDAVILADGGGVVVVDRSTISGGALDGGSGSVLVGSDGMIADTEVLGTWMLDDGSDVVLAGEIGGAGEFVIQHRMTDGDAIVYAADGAVIDIPLRLNTAPEASLLNARLRRRGTGEPATIGDTGGVTGRGRIDDGVYNLAGVLSPGSGTTGIGVLQLTFTQFDMTPTGRVAIDIGGPGEEQFDRIVGFRSGMTLDGTLELNFIGGYVPGPDEQIEVIRDMTITGRFAAVDIEPVGAGGAHVVYGADSVTIVMCVADLDGDGELTIFDFLAFQNLFDAGDARADLDEDGSLTIFDFLAFQNLFDAGCS